MPPLESRLRSLIRSAPADAALPTTRMLGRRFAVSYTTVFRALRRLAESGEAWQHPNGRFYPAAAQALLERPRPIACL
ncbi:MAG: GntR family transcriptional regulator, partial [Opitutaceae bacterium]